LVFIISLDYAKFDQGLSLVLFVWLENLKLANYKMD